MSYKDEYDNLSQNEQAEETAEIRKVRKAYLEFMAALAHASVKAWTNAATDKMTEIQAAVVDTSPMAFFTECVEAGAINERDA